MLGYHGCDRAFGERLLDGKGSFNPSKNDYDWLGPGVYFWESSPYRALEFAQEKKKRGDGVRDPFVVGAVIDIGYCLDLSTKDSIEDLRSAHLSLMSAHAQSGQPAPRNGPEDWRRRLDCAVIRFLHQILKESSAQPIDTVRGMFTEGNPIYDGTRLLEKTHVQVAVVNPACIKAVFRVPRSVTR